MKQDFGVENQTEGASPDINMLLDTFLVGFFVIALRRHFRRWGYGPLSSSPP